MFVVAYILKNAAKVQKIFDISPLFTTKNFSTCIFTGFRHFEVLYKLLCYNDL